MIEYLRLIKLDWFTDSSRGWHGHTPLSLMAVVALGIVVVYFVLKRN
jgi:acid phosphatase family membrane protein YuiD